VIKISIVTATYNAADTVAVSIGSVRGQGIDVEHIIIDGGSTDSTIEILNPYQDSIKYFISEADEGIYEALNKGLNLATGEIIGILHADDYYPSNDVLKTVLHVFEDTSIDACYGDLIYVDQNDTSKIVRNWQSLEYDENRFYWGWMPPHPTFFVRRSVYEKFGIFREDIGTAADYEIMLRFLLKHKIKAKYIPKVLVHMRTGGISNRSLKNRIKANRMDRRAWEVNNLTPYPWTLWVKPLRKIGQWFNNS